MRVSVRLDEKRSERFEFLKRATGEGTTAILRRAIDRYYGEVSRGVSRAAEVLARTGFIGSGEGRGDLSTDYKRYLDEG